MIPDKFLAWKLNCYIGISSHFFRENLGAKGTSLFQEALVTQFLGNYLLEVHPFWRKSYPRDRVRDGIIPGQLFKDCIGKYSDDYCRKTSVVSRYCEMVSQEKHFTIKTVLALGRAYSRKT